MKKQVRKILTAISAFVFLFSSVMVVGQLHDNSVGADSYQMAEDLSEKEGVSKVMISDPCAEKLTTIDLDALRAINPDVLGWIYIPNTTVNYPLLQAKDNEEYLNKTWNMEKSSVGSIFLECKNSPDFSDYDTIIYGHRMRNGSMFGCLKDYESQEFFEKHQKIYIATDDGVSVYSIFAAYKAGVKDHTYRLEITEGEDKQEVIDLALSDSIIKSGIEPSVEDNIITLSTCTGRGYRTRWVVQAVISDFYQTQPAPEAER